MPARTQSQRWLWTLGTVAGLWTGAAGQIPAQTSDSVPLQVVPLNRSAFQEILDAEPYDMPILVRHMHRQDPNALRPSDALQTAPPRSTQGSQVARNLLGVPQRNELLARRGRLRLVAASQNRASPMIGDLFGGGSTTLSLTRTLSEVIPFASAPESGKNFNGFLTFNGGNPDAPFFGGPVTGSALPLLTAIGVDTNGDKAQDLFPGLLQYKFTNGVADPNSIANPGPFEAAVVGNKTFVNANGDTVPVLDARQTLNIDGVPSPGSGGAVGRVKIAENTSPLPRDRMFFNYSYFDGVPLTKGGINVNRFTPGFEKTIQDGTASIEVRTPFATTLGSNVSTPGVSDGNDLEFGNVSITYKSLFHRDEEVALSAGLQTSLPTGDPINVNLADGSTIFKVKNQSVHLMPFVGGLYTPNERFFSQGFVQFDFAANGDDILADLDFTKLRRVGTVQESSFLYLDWSAGYWTYLAEDEGAFLTGVAPIVELHFNQSLQHRDVVTLPGNFQFGTAGRNFSVMNAVLGTTFQFGPQSALTAAYATPLGGGADQQFNGEFRLFFNRRFGPQTVQTRAF